MRIKKEHSHSKYIEEQMHAVSAANEYAVRSSNFWDGLTVEDIERFNAITGAVLYIGQTPIAGLPLLMFVCDKEVSDEHFTFV